MAPEDLSRGSLRLSVVRAMTYAVTPQFRQVTASIDPGADPPLITIRFLFEPPEDENLTEVAEVIATEVVANYRTAHIATEIVYSNEPMRSDQTSGFDIVFARRERGMFPALDLHEPIAMFGDFESARKHSWSSRCYHSHPPVVAGNEVVEDAEVEGVVVCTHDFGVGVWLSESGVFGHVNGSHLELEQWNSLDDLPRIGTRLKLRVIGFNEMPTRQLRLSQF